MNDVIISVEDDKIDPVVESHATPVEKEDGIKPYNDNQEKDKSYNYNQEKGKPHNGEPITRLEVSPNGIYLVTYSENDHSIVGWNIKDIDKELQINDEKKGSNGTNIDEGQLKPDNTVQTVNINDKFKNLKQICVSDDKKLVCFYIYNNRNYLKIIDMNNMNREIELYFNRGLYPYYCTFNLKNDFILCGNVYDKNEINDKKNINDKNIDRCVWTYSTRTENNKWKCKEIYKIPRGFELISISKSDKVYLLSNNSIYQWNILTGNTIRSLFINENVKEESEGKEVDEEEDDNEDEEKEGNKGNEKKEGIEEKEKKEGNEEKEMVEKEKEEDEKNKHKKEDIKIEDIKITSNERFICLRIKDKITIYSIGLKIPIATLDINDDNQLCDLINHPGLYHLLPSLFDLFICDSIMKCCWKKCLNRLKKGDQTPPNNIQIKECLKKNDQIHPNNAQTTTKYAFGILNGYVWKVRFDEKTKFLNSETCEGTYDHLNIHLFTDMDTLLNQELIDFINDTMTKEMENDLENDDERLGGNDNDYEVEVSVNTFMEDKLVAKEFIYIEVPKKDKHIKVILIDEGGDHRTVDKKIRVPTGVPMNDNKHVDEFIYVKVPTNVLIDDKNEATADVSTDEMLINEDEFIQGLIKIKFSYNRKKFELEVFKISAIGNGWEWNSICKKIEKCNFEISLLEIRLFNNNDIAILTKQGFFIYYFNEYNKSISLNYFYSVDQEHIVEYYKQVIRSKSTFSTPNYDSFNFDGWVKYLKGNKESFLKYGVELLTFAIKEHNIDLIEEIYEKCIKYFQEDVNNRMFLNIITSTMPLLKDYYPEFVLRYLSETNMIIDSSFYNVERQNESLHLYSFFQNPKILPQSILWTKFNYKFHNNFMIMIIQLLLLPLTLPLFAFFILFSNYHFNFINDIYKCNLFSVFYFYILDEISTRFSEHKSSLMITFMVPYIKFINYSENYNWFMDWIKPQPSSFIETIHSKEIYKTWNGEAIINFKWNTYGKHHYYAIWIGFVALLACFTIAATLPSDSLDVENRKNLLIASIILCLIHLNVEVRQIFYDPIRWIKDSWNYIDIIVYVLPIITSIYWLSINDLDNRSGRVATLLSISCLFLDLKLLLFFRVFRSYGRYFAITISVAKKVYIFLVVFLAIIMMSFAHAFHILLSPKLRYSFDNPDLNNNDPNNPWQLTSSYAVLNDDNTSAGLQVIQEPDENTNLFSNYRTALFAMTLFLTGDLSSLSNWKYGENTTIMLLVVFFTFLTVIYLLNVFIGLFTEVIQDDALEASQLILKAEMLAEIELFYLLPHQRRWKNWFPDVLYYNANVDETREKVQEMISKKGWNEKEFSKLRKDLLNKLNIHDHHSE